MEFRYEDEYMSCAAKGGRNIHQLQREFDQWIYDRGNDHPYWEIAYIDEEGNEGYGVSFSGEAFVNWLNNVKFSKRKKVARLVSTVPSHYKKVLRF
ncbi:hypothetical protein [Priestia koreensis]|nr:hypothetical protein [Priestia koreensis]